MNINKNIVNLLINNIVTKSSSDNNIVTEPSSDHNQDNNTISIIKVYRFSPRL